MVPMCQWLPSWQSGALLALRERRLASLGGHRHKRMQHKCTHAYACTRAHSLNRQHGTAAKLRCMHAAPSRRTAARSPEHTGPAAWLRIVSRGPVGYASGRSPPDLGGAFLYWFGRGSPSSRGANANATREPPSSPAPRAGSLCYWPNP